MYRLTHFANFTSWYLKLQNQISCGLVIKTSYEVVKHFRICFSWKFWGFLCLYFRTGGTGGRGVFHYPDFDWIRRKNLFHQKTLYAGDTKFLDLPPALNYCNAESNIQINVSLVSSLTERISNTKNYFWTKHMTCLKIH